MASVVTTLSQAANSIRELLGSTKPGLQAIKEADRNRITCTAPRRLSGSIDLDSTLKNRYPADARWDYVIGMRRRSGSDVLRWIEVHPANSRSVSALLKKASWLKSWTEGSGMPLLDLCEGRLNLIWISTGSVAIRRGSPQQFKLAQAGIKFPVKHLELG